MKPVYFLLLAGLLFTACSKDDEFSCDKNTSFSTNARDQCAHGRVTQHSELDTYERFIIAVSNGTMNFELRATNETGALVEDHDYVRPGATVVAPWVNLVKDIKIRFTKIDREAGKISGEFSFEVESEYGVERANGRFTDIDF